MQVVHCTLRHLSQKMKIYIHTKQKVNGHSSFIQNNQELGELQEPSLGGTLNKVRYIYTVEHNLVIKELSANTQLHQPPEITLSTMTSPNSVLYSSISVIL